MSDNRRDRDAYGSASPATAPATDAGRVTSPISRPVIVLITAFESSDPPNRNASAVLLDALMQNIAKLEDEAGGAIIRTKLMPSNTHALEQALSSALDERPAPTHLLAIGQAPGRNRITLERIATNLRDFQTPDRAGNRLSGTPILDDGAVAYKSTWPNQEGAIAALKSAGIPAAMSNTAGNNLCNQILYIAQYNASIIGTPDAATFMHIPMLPEQIVDEEPMTLREPNCPFMPLPMLVRGVCILLRSTLGTGFGLRLSRPPRPGLHA